MQFSSEILSRGSPPFFGPPFALKRTARKINTDVVQRVLDHHKRRAPKKRAEASDKSARKRLVIAAYILSRDRAHAVFWLKRELATARTAHCNSIDQDSGALVSRATASCARLAFGPLGSSFR